jgi:hypothetical protein
MECMTLLELSVVLFAPVCEDLSEGRIWPAKRSMGKSEDAPQVDALDAIGAILIRPAGRPRNTPQEPGRDRDVSRTTRRIRYLVSCLRHAGDECPSLSIATAATPSRGEDTSRNFQHAKRRRLDRVHGLQGGRN